jgi:hypothetical protein
VTGGRPRCRATLRVLLDPDRAGSAALADARRHAASCLDCSSVLDDPAAATAALTVLAGARPRSRPLTRVLLAVVAAVQVTMALPWLFGADPTGTAGGTMSEHLTRDGAIGVAVGVAGLFAARRPTHARVVAASCTAPIVVQIVTGVADGVGDRVQDRFELVHLAVVAIVVLALLAGRPSPGPRSERRRPVPVRPVP